MRCRFGVLNPEVEGSVAPGGGSVACVAPPHWRRHPQPGGRGAGHIWYDFLHDVVPHRDRFNRKWDNAWTPKMGRRQHWHGR